MSSDASLAEINPLIVTEKGGHMCWFEGVPPTRWYPRAIFQFIEDVTAGKKVSQLA